MSFRLLIASESRVELTSDKKALEDNNSAFKLFNINYILIFMMKNEMTGAKHGSRI